MSTLPRDSYHHGDLRNTLLDAAMQMLESGESFSLRAVARRAQVSQTAPYRHFADREALESALAVRGFQELFADLSNDGSPARTEAEIVEFGVAYVRFALRRPTVFKLMFGQECGVEDDRVVAAQEVRTLLAGSLQLIYPHSDHDALATALWALTHGLAFLHLDGKLPAADPDEVAMRVRSSFAALRSTFSL